MSSSGLTVGGVIIHWHTSRKLPLGTNWEKQRSEPCPKLCRSFEKQLLPIVAAASGRWSQWEVSEGHCHEKVTYMCQMCFLWSSSSLPQWGLTPWGSCSWATYLHPRLKSTPLPSLLLSRIYCAAGGLAPSRTTVLSLVPALLEAQVSICKMGLIVYLDGHLGEDWASRMGRRLLCGPLHLPKTTPALQSQIRASWLGRGCIL